VSTQGSDSEVSSVLSTYKSEGNPDLYEEAYLDLKKFVESALDVYKVIQYVY
jgi:transcription initiation factor TFIID subunit 5